jgi:bacteriocin biosynthesis cyclodehydratase domain-containing protein
MSINSSYDSKVGPMNSHQKPDVSSDRLIALPVQLMSIDGGVILVRGVTELCISGERGAEVVHAVLAAASGEGVTRRDLVEQFAATDREMVGKLVDELVSRSILMRAGAQPKPDSIESGFDVFYWHFGQTARATLDRMSEKPIVLMGVNAISRQIALSLRSLGVERVQVVDFHTHRNLRMHDSAGNLKADEWPTVAPLAYDTWAEGLENQEFACLVATSDFGCPHLMREWNRFCVENRVHFLPVMLERFTGTIGPLVIPGETACYECLHLRENANMSAPEIGRIVELGPAEQQAVTGFHPAMANVLGELAAMELCKIYGGGIPWRTNRIIEVNLLAPSLFSRQLLKLPLCPVCSPALKTTSVDPYKDLLVPAQHINFHDQ